MLLGVCVLGAFAGCGEEEQQGGLQAASPGPDAVVGGEIDQIELLYDDIIATVGGTVTGPDGEVLDAEFVIDNQIRALVQLTEPLSEPGEYTVRSVVVSVVGDEVDEVYVFTYEPDAAPPQLVFPPEEDSGSPVVFWSLVAAGAAVIAVLIGRRCRRRAAAPVDRGERVEVVPAVGQEAVRPSRCRSRPGSDATPFSITLLTVTDVQLPATIVFARS